MTKKYTFRCADCERVSDFRERVTRRVEHAAPRGASQGDAIRSETRTYRCQHCRVDNFVTNPAGYWVLVDECSEAGSG